MNGPSQPNDDPRELYRDPVGLLRRLIRFDTTNPPGNEAACVGYIENLLSKARIETRLLAKDPRRPNLVARIPGGKAAPLLLHGHVDVVSADARYWRHPPFEGTLENGYVWGRGALDMKGGVAMLLAAFLRAKVGATPLPGDVILALVADEEAGGNRGSKYLVEEHPELFEGVRYAIGEFGGFALHLGGRRFYPIQVAEKQLCRLRATVRAQGAGHGALPQRNGAMARTGRLLDCLDRRRLPVHITPAARDFLAALAHGLPYPTGGIVRRLLGSSATERALGLPPSLGQLPDALLRNTVRATGVRGGGNPHSVPEEVVVDLEARLLPGFGPADLITELAGLAENLDVLFEVLRYDPGPPPSDMSLLPVLEGVLREADPGGIPVPLLAAGVTDARFFAHLGIQTYGFLPMNLPPGGARLLKTMHGADERIPMEALAFGANAIHETLRRFGGG
ncbi:M20/M25/M40 family metallo-hydrolase [Rubrobacter marinus]|uniref:M20/M25/M40 family metallo-hydrolase n=1 Tax=Rubrobacter marinus TaxID=2653852 RepID=A0A6G8PW97_9ACTN|nr:M20/M25/M40 family metallo-hydrolase [Rubrobacter marinus]QIN78463.1 M20/M25/M40 family metallo-hydrolase [Rubrobacter marinus]